MTQTRTFLRIALGICLVGSLAMSLSLYEVASRSAETNEQVEKTHAVLLAIGETEKTFDGFDEALRDRLANLPPFGVEKAHAAAKAVQHELHELDLLLARDTAQPEAARMHLVAAGNAFAQLARLAPPLEVAQVDVTPGETVRHIATALRSALSDLEQVEIQLLASRRQASHQSTARMLWALIALGLTCFTGMALLYRTYSVQAGQLERAESRFANLVQSLPVTTWQLRAGGGRPSAFNFVSDNVRQLLGPQADPALMTPAQFAGWVHPVHRVAYEEALASAQSSGQPWSIDFRVQLPGAKARWLRSCATPFTQYRGATLWSGYWADVTDEVETELALARASEEARSASAAKSNFLASVSHEIRTPLNGMLGMLELLALRARTSEDREMLGVVRQSGESLLLIVNDLLDFSKIEAGRLELNLAPDNLTALLNATCEIFRGAAEQKGLMLELDVSAGLATTLVFDRLRLSQVLNNLMSNAVKFTQQGGVTLRVSLVQNDPRQQLLDITVQDSGPGITPDVQARLFRPYTQADAGVAARHGGTGLGLVICQRLAELMGGTLTMHSQPSCGTSLTLRVALAKVHAAAAVPAPAPAAPLPFAAGAPATQVPLQDSSTPRVLVVDDHPINRALIQRQLGLLGYASDCAADGAEALQQWRSGRYGAVIADCNMPGMDGYAMAAYIRDEEARTGIGRTPIIACTANAMASATEKCLSAGMDDYLVKPVQLDALGQALARWVPAVAHGTALDDAVLYAACGADEGLRRDLLAQFASVHAQDLLKLGDAWHRRERASIRELAHRMRGSCMMVGAQAMALALGHVEQVAAGGDDEALRAAMHRVEVEDERLRRTLAPAATTADS